MTAQPTRDSKRSATRTTVTLVAGAAVLVVVVIAIVSARHTDHAASSSAPTTVAPATSTTTWVPPPGLAGLVRGDAVAVVDDRLVSIGSDGSVRRLLNGVTRQVHVMTSSGREFLVGTLPWEAMIAGPRAVVAGEVLPTGIDLIPDAEGRWWSNYGRLGGGRSFKHLTFPGGARPVAKLRDGYLLVDAAQRSLFARRDDGTSTPVAPGDARVLAVAGDLLAWAPGSGGVVHVANLATGERTTVEVAGTPVTARFSPDGSRVALLQRAADESMVLADTASGRVITRLRTGAGLYQFREAPPALQPAPFTWDGGSGNLLVVTTSADGSRIVTVDPGGAVVHTVPAPAGVSQLVTLR